MTQESELTDAIVLIKQKIAEDKKINKEYPNTASWVYEQGVLLTRNEAKVILKYLFNSLNP